MIVSIVAAACAMFGFSPTNAVAVDGWTLVWSDEFNKQGAPNPADWEYENGFVRNEEDQWYQPANAVCKGGNLVIEARREQKPNPDYVPGSSDWRKNRANAQFTSASITTRGKHSWLYGRFEMRARIDTRPGMWPAFWTLGQDGEWPSNGEIDIMEYYRGNLLANVAWGSGKRWQAVWASNKFPLTDLNKTDKDWAKKFHIWRMDWTAEAIKLFVDNRLLNEVPLERAINVGSNGVSPFKQPHYMILNLAIGGANGGNPDNTTFPGKFEVDYVRVYQQTSTTAQP